MISQDQQQQRGISRHSQDVCRRCASVVRVYYYYFYAWRRFTPAAG
jgi:hypothetical protein